ncbi:MAG TPA: peptidylprolyl isomerase [Candidatus Limnocylindrales bacterium]
MTFRAKPVVKRSHRLGSDTRDRRNLYMNLAFGLVVLVAIVILGIAGGASWYGAHLEPVASVNGQSITKDDFNLRLKIESHRLDVSSRRLNTEHAAGRLTDQEWQAQLQIVTQGQQGIAQQTLDRLIDSRVQATLAQQEGIAVTPQQIDAQITKEATSPEQRHAWMIEVAPTIDAGKDAATAAQVAAAKKIADTALADLASGKKWEDVAKAVSTDSSASSGGDLSWITTDTTLDEPFKAALFTLPKDGRTGVIQGADGSFRIGRVTDIVTATVDQSYRAQLSDAGISADEYNGVVRSDLVRTALEDKIKAQALQAGPERRVAQIFIQAPQSGSEPVPGDGSVKVRHILFSPNGDPQNASKVPAGDPAWKKAETLARAAYARVEADPSQFDPIARKESNEQGDDVSGGKLPYFNPQMSASGQLDPAFGKAIFAPGLKAGDILEPIRSAFGWHVIQIMYFPPDLDEAKKLKAQAEAGTPFTQLAKDFSDGAEAAKGGELGWIAPLQIDQKSSAAIFAAPVGGLTDPLEIASDGIHVYKILEAANRAPDGAQKTTIEQQAFPNWYEAKKAGFDIHRDVDFSNPTG